jgi:hypothetical protein
MSINVDLETTSPENLTSKKEKKKDISKFCTLFAPAGSVNKI